MSLDLPVSRSKVHATSVAVNGLPSCQVTPSRSGKVSSVPSSFHDQPVAKSGTIDCRLFCGTCWSNITRLLKTPIIGPSAKTVASSWIDMLAGLSGEYILRIPPDFWASAGSTASSVISNPPIATNTRGLRSTWTLSDTYGSPHPLFGGTFRQNPQPNSAISGPVLSGSRSTCRWMIVYQKIRKGGIALPKPLLEGIEPE